MSLKSGCRGVLWHWGIAWLEWQKRQSALTHWPPNGLMEVETYMHTHGQIAPYTF